MLMMVYIYTLSSLKRKQRLVEGFKIKGGFIGGDVCGLLTASPFADDALVYQRE